ncbi:pentatricopeptide repeat-containing protein At4g21065-like [Amborella trichopoda]|uniref:pentatricopeptide repeat-containing protein At4g21065-like n=1 Tax=Amborella trichopoda TaxID=13333 RepID=UPI0005D34DFB|nr:pentatricopeptide repeat-containing protein At4g21065-like [Amborella trichopoda]|eukprot:XP_011626008.1 pentatricopeptide repeat-containing protein At4g21065-like [Amborella trichopoda]
MDYACMAFNQINQPGSYTWNTMIRGFSCSLNPLESLKFYSAMRAHGLIANSYTFSFTLKACARVSAISEAQELHTEITKVGLCWDVNVINTLIHVYANYGELENAGKLFDEMPYRTVVSWNAMVGGFNHRGCFGDALDLFNLMRGGLQKPDGVTVAMVLSSCANLGALGKGQLVHSYLETSDINMDLVIGNALMDMYAKCGSLEDCQKVFERMTKRDLVSWNSMINAFAVNGNASDALDIFRSMRSDSIRPDAITFVSVLRACSHAGLVHEGKEIFSRMKVEYGVEPEIEHYGCMVDLLGRAGFLEEALNLIETMPLERNAIILRALLGACKVHGNVELGRSLVRDILELEGSHSGDYVSLSNIYASRGKWEGAARVRRMMRESGVAKVVGYSLIEVKDTIHKFLVGDKSHPQGNSVYEMLDEIGKKLKLEGHLPNTSFVLYDIGEEEKEENLSVHSERLAIAFGLIRTRAGETIRIVKNLRVCTDCHSVTKLISKIYDRRIIVRDRSRFHHFNRGTCSCMDYW